ncbi:hypothetical protein V1463_10575 [Micrococcus yunnanensis]|uniref:hypothetical protein n=1 Tax=Micrococcus yunnanensis TaxID=566027 RepID=UPI00300E02AE
MAEHVAAGEAREALDDLHLAAHENGPTTDMSTHFRRAHRLWDAMGGKHRTAYGEPIPAWDDLGAHKQLMLAGLVARAVQDVLEVEQVMYRALVAVLDLAVRLDAEAEELHDFSGGMSDESEWLAATVTRVRTALNGETHA